MDKEFEEKIKKLEQKFTGKGGSTGTNKRILAEYKVFVSSKDFKNFSIEFKNNDIFIWHLNLDILKFELTPELRADFEQYQAKTKRNAQLVFEVLFS